MHDKLGLKQEDENETKAREDACDTRGSSTVHEDMGASSPPRVQKRAVRKMTPKKKKIG
jgi:ribosomal protein L13